MDFQAKDSNEFFSGLGVEFHQEIFTPSIAQMAAREIEELYQLKSIIPKQKLLRRTIVWLYFKQHHLLSMLKKPGFFQQAYLFLLSKIIGIKL
jgi:transposase